VSFRVVRLDFIRISLTDRGIERGRGGDRGWTVGGAGQDDDLERLRRGGAAGVGDADDDGLRAELDGSGRP
jgi:hypothetical protein